MEKEIGGGGPPLNLIPALHYLDRTTMDEQEEPHSRTIHTLTLTHIHSTLIGFVAVYGCQL